MNDKGYLIEIQYSLLSREKETYLAPVESATRYTTWTKKQRKTLKGSLCSRWITGGQLTLNAPGAKTFMFVHDKLISTVQQQKGCDNNINYKYRKSNTPT